MTDLTPDKLAAIKEAAEKATPGPWEVDTIQSDGDYGYGDESHTGYRTSQLCDANGKAIADALNSDVGEVHEEYDQDGCYAWDEIAGRNFTYIALCDPQTVLAMVARIEALEAENARLREALADCIDTLDHGERPAIASPARADAVQSLGEIIGYGALMSCASALWRESLASAGHPVGGEFVVGNCRATVDATLRRARAALEGGR